MKKITTLLFVIVLLIAAGCATTTEETVETAAVQNTGDTEKEPAKAAEEKAEPEFVTEIIQVPYKTKEISFYSDGFVESYRVFTYDDNMKVVREDLFDSFDAIIESLVYDSLSESEVKVSLYNERGELQSWKMNIYDAAGYLERVESYSPEDVLQTVSVYEYDGAGKKTAWRVADGDEVVLSETKYIYNGDMLNKIEIYNAGNSLVEYFEKVYMDGLLVSEEHYESDGKILSSVEYVYEDKTLVQENHKRANGSVSRTVKYTNDSKGSPVKAEFYDGNGKLKDWSEYEYEYRSEERKVRR